MEVINRNKAINSIRNALDCHRQLIDGRTEQDYLNFLANFSSLINFYDDKNELYDSWNPVLLKDSTILTACISKSDFNTIQNLYLHTWEKINAQNSFKQSGFLLESVLLQLIKVFNKIADWSSFMIKSDKNYDLKTYLLRQVESNYAKYLWALLDLKEELHNSKLLNDITAVEWERFQNYDEKTWRDPRYQDPFWKVLNIDYPLKSKNLEAVFNGVEKTGDKLLAFFKKLHDHASIEFNKLKLDSVEFPDTLLIRTFVKLLLEQQEDLNSISCKLLNFYYTDILKQTPQEAVADRAYLCIDLGKTNSTFDLPINSLFNAGFDTNKRQIAFKSIHPVSLNTGKIASAYTLSKSAVEDGDALKLLKIENPGKLKKNESGSTITWNTFGSSTITQTSPLEMGFAIASPILLLNEGTRDITITLSFDNSISTSFINSAKFFFSTTSKWLQVQKQNKISEESSCVDLKFTLNPTEPPITNFKKNPDGLVSSWPMFKVLFNTFPDLNDPPNITSLTVNVVVFGLQSLALYNDHGALSTKQPFQLFGASAEEGSNFMIGSAEAFSKPLDLFNIEFDWLNLPDDFRDYYFEYNAYLANAFSSTCRIDFKIVGQSLKNLINKILLQLKKRIPKWLKGIIPEFLKKWARKLIEEFENALSGKTTFNNCCFQVGFSQLQNGSWTDINLKKKESCYLKKKENHNGTHKTIECPDFVLDSQCNLSKSPSGALLFSPKGNLCLLNSKSDVKNPIKTPNPSVFLYDKGVKGDGLILADPTLQSKPLKYSSHSESGFMRMTLNSPEYGFGNEIYAKVVSAIAMINALIITGIINISTIRKLLKKLMGTSDDPQPKTAFVNAASKPFAPKVKKFTANYVASQTFEFEKVKGEYPIQFFSYSVFKNYEVYNSPPAPVEPVPILHGPVKTKPKIPNYPMPVYPEFKYNGALYLEFEDVTPPMDINLYFELAPSFYEYSATNNNLEFNYLSEKGWETLPIMNDGTANFSCSGILSANLQEDATNSHPHMPGSNYWIAIGVNCSPDSFPQTAFLKANAIEVERAGTDFLKDKATPIIKSNTITKPLGNMPQIANVMQPFSSFGGIPAESHKDMYLRVCNRLKTKDRIITPADIYTSLKHKFPEICYSRSIFDASNNTTSVYVVPEIENVNALNAFIPRLNNCKLEAISKYLNSHSSVFNTFVAKNFNLHLVTVSAFLYVDSTVESATFKESVIQKLNLYISPWIVSQENQIPFCSGLTVQQLEQFFLGFPEVESVDHVSKEVKEFSLGMETVKNQVHKTQDSCKSTKLYVPDLKQEITIKPYHV